VAELLAGAMVELGYRKNPVPVLTSANDILSEQDPPAVFEALVKSAEGGTLFIVSVSILFELLTMKYQYYSWYY
jgi:hypothetical protein